MRVSRTALGAAGVFLFALALYAGTLRHGYVLDDSSNFTGNAFVQRGFAGIGKILATEHGAGAGERNFTYRPLVLVTFAVEKALFGNNPAVGHGVNILLYAAACAALFVLLARLPAPLLQSVALPAALLFAAHPAHVEVVANIKSRDEILCLLFLLGLLEGLRRYAAAGKGRHLAAALALFALALLTKEHAITFVALVPLTLRFFSGLRPAAIARATVPFAALAALYLLVRKAVVGAVSMPGGFGGLTNVLTLAQTPSEALGTRLLILGEYLRLLVVPLRLSHDYSYNIVPVTRLADVRAVAAGLAFLALLGAGLWGLRRRSAAGYGLLFFLVTFSVVSNSFVLLRWTMAERFLFTPSLGFCIAAAAGGQALLGRAGSGGKAGRIALAAVFSLVLLAFSARTVARSADWKSELDLYRRDAATHPEGARIRNSLGIAYKNRSASAGDALEREKLLRLALEEFRRSIEIYPDFPRPHEGLAYVQYALDDFAAAERAARRALELAPVSVEATHLLAGACFSQGKHEEALALLKRTLLLSPGYPGIEVNLADVYFAMGRYRDAAASLRGAIGKSSGDAGLYERLGAAHRAAGEFNEARAAYATAFALRPDPALQRTLRELEEEAARGKPPLSR